MSTLCGIAEVALGQVRLPPVENAPPLVFPAQPVSAPLVGLASPIATAAPRVFAAPAVYEFAPVPAVQTSVAPRPMFVAQPAPGVSPGEYLGEDTQDAPRAMNVFDDVRNLPPYYYDYWYYNTYGIGARPLPDYAPPGYEPRDYQDAPGVPEFSRITPPPLPSEVDTGNFVTRGMYPGSFLVPGVNTSIRLRGFVRLAALGDFDPIGVADAFVTNSIPVPQQVGRNFNMSARISRFALESWTPTNFRDWNVHTFIEGDFFNGAAQAAGGGGNPFRLRHAFFDFGYFRFGQQNSVFMDGTNWPSLVDFQGPNSWVNQRQPSARVTVPVVDSVYWAAAMERPFSDITTNGLGTNVQEAPDFSTHLRFETDLGHAQVAGLFREIGYRPTGGEVDHDTAAAISGSLVVHPWAILLGTDPVHEENPSGLTRSRILLMAASGRGIGRYLNDLAGQGFDGQVDPVTGEFFLVDSTGWNASYEHWWNEHWLSNFTYSRVEVDNNAGQPGTTYDGAEYLAASLWWLPIPRMSFGIEYLWGERHNLDGQDSDAQRLHGLFQYNF
ncbi:MAG: DcaP family trimeric outer membrane transporter [Pirellulales bacterium]